MNRFPSLASIFILLLALHPHFAVAQGTAFTYQGRLTDGTNLATGCYDLTFAVFSDSNAVSQVGDTVTNLATTVNGGLFNVSLDFGPGIFTGPSLWLQIGAETNGDDGDDFTLLSPLQSLTPAPYSIYSATSGSSSYATAATTAYGVSAGSVSGADIAPTSVVKSLNNLQDAVTLAAGANITISPDGNTLTIASSGGGGGGGGNSWSLTGNAGTSPANGNFLGTTDNEPLLFEVDGQTALTIEPDPNGTFAPNIISGSYINGIGSGLSGATISGGGAYAYLDYGNYVEASWGTIAGGWGNEINSSGYTATIGGGAYNNANGQYSTVPGGYLNTTAGKYSFAAGYSANAAYVGDFVWADSQGTSFSSTTNDQFCIRAQGGILLGPGTTTIGSTNNQPLSFSIDGQTAFALEPDPNGTFAPNIIGGSYLNGIDSGLSGVTISGGGALGLFDYGNFVSASWGTIAGGWGNEINPGGYTAAIGGGAYNTADGQYSTIPGGYGNSASGNNSFAAGESASASDNSSFVWGDGSRSALSQGPNTFTILATGGVYLYTTTSGVNVNLDNTGDFNFGSSVRQMLNLYNTTYGIGIQNDDMYFRCDSSISSNGFAWYRGGTANSNPYNSGGGSTLMTLTTSGLTVNGTFVSASDRNLKEHFSAVDSRSVLEKVDTLPIQNWNYKADTASRHIGPMAQDFYAAFNVGPDDKHIAVVDEGGVALAAIQGLNQKLEVQMKEKDDRIADLEKRLNDLAQTVQNLTGRK